MSGCIQRWVLVVVLAAAVTLACHSGDASLAAKVKRRRRRSGTTRRRTSRKVVAHPATSVVDRGLVTEDVSWKSIVAHYREHSSEVTVNRFPRESLVFVTPWNNHGYNVAKWFNAKFTYVSPVWLQLRPNGITGTHDIDVGWMRDVRARCGDNPTQCPLIVPRLIWEGIGTLAGEEGQSAIQDIVSLCVKRNFDGLVLEMNPLTPDRLTWLESLGAEMHSTLSRRGVVLKLIVVLPPTRIHNGHPHGMDQDTFTSLAHIVDRVSLMTYDYSVQYRQGGPNSPLPWAELAVGVLLGDPPRPELARKLLLGLPWYGYDNTQAILGNDYLALLRKVRPKVLQWNAEAQEHYFEYTQNGKLHTVYYPSLLSIQKRLELADRLGTGISIWEIGQGLDYWHDLV